MALERGLKMKTGRGFTRWLSRRGGEKSPVGELAKWVMTDTNWLSNNRFFSDFVRCLERAEKEELIPALAVAWKEYCGQEVPLLTEEYFRKIARATYNLETTCIFTSTLPYSSLPGYEYVYALLYKDKDAKSVRFIGRTSTPTLALKDHLTNYNKRANIPLISLVTKTGKEPTLAILETTTQTNAPQRVKAFAWYFSFVEKEHLFNTENIEYEA